MEIDPNLEPATEGQENISVTISVPPLRPFSTKTRHDFTSFIATRGYLTRNDRAEIRALLTDEKWVPGWWFSGSTNAAKRSRAKWASKKHDYKERYTLDANNNVQRVLGQERLIQVFDYDVFDVIMEAHCQLIHAGIRKTQDQVNRTYYGVHRKEIEWMLEKCAVCDIQRRNQTRASLQPIIAARVLERLQLDLVDMRSTPSGPYTWILHIRDHYSKFSMLYALESKEATPIADCIMEYIKYYGLFEIFQSDNGKEFKGAVLLVCKRLGIKIVNGKPRTPRTQGLVEQANGILKRKITAWKALSGSSDWHEGLIDIQRAMNRQGTAGLPHGISAWDVFFGRAYRDLSDAQ